MLRAAISSLVSPSAESSHLLVLSSSSVLQTRGRRRSLTPAPWLPPVYTKNSDLIDDENRKLLAKVVEAERELIVAQKQTQLGEVEAANADIASESRRVGLLARKIGMMPQWTNTGERMLCTLLEISENNVVSVTTPEDWYRTSIVGKRKAFNREGPMHKVTVGAINGDAHKFTHAYRNQFVRAQVPIKHHLGSFLVFFEMSHNDKLLLVRVTEDALPQVGMPLDARHFSVGQFVTASGRSIDWGFQGGMHRWGMRGQPTRRTTKSHRRIGSVGSVGDARIWPGKRMPGHMGFEWVTVSGLQIIRMNLDKQVIYVKGSVPGEVGDIIQLKDCLQADKKLKTGPVPTWTPSLEVIAEEEEETESAIPAELRANEVFIPSLFRFSSPSIAFTDADARKAAGRDKTKAKIAKVKK